MKHPICPSCKHEVLNAIEVYLKASTTYSFNRLTQPFYQSIWNDWAYDSIFKVKKEKGFLGFRCRFCGKDFPKEQEKELWNYAKMRHVLTQLKGKEK